MLRPSPGNASVQASIRGLPVHLTAGIDHALGRGAMELAREGQSRAPKAFSTLAISVGSRRLGLMRYEVSAGQHYAMAVHEGLLPGTMPPVEHIEEWVRIKGITPHDPTYNQRDLAWMIARSIESKGTKPQPFMDDALQTKKHRIRSLLAAAVNSARTKARAH